MGLRFKVMAALLALLWLPMVSHCDLEHLPGLEFLACCDHADTGPHQDDDCQTDLCASVESGHYKTEERAITAPAPAPQATLVATLLIPALENSVPTIAATPSVPAELRQRWQFAFRTAAPPRAPSFVS